VKQRILDALGRSRAEFTELRLRRIWSTAVLARGRTVETATTALETGGAIRCCSSGTGWGMVGFSGNDRLDIEVLRAHELALAGASHYPVSLAAIAIHQVETPSPLADDPREVPLPEKRQLAELLAARLFSRDRRITDGRILCRDEVVETWLATSEGTWIHDFRSEVSVAGLAVAEEDGNVERALGSHAVSGGWRSAAGAEAMIDAMATRAVDRLHAAPVRPGRYPVVLDPAAAGALLHRAVAHVARPALPGADPDVLPMGTRVGPDCLTVADDPTAESLRASAHLDDEGTVARRTTIVQNGVVVGHLHSRETAAASHQAPTGHARAGTLRGAPHPRVTNTSLSPGEGSLDDLLRGIPLGVYVVDALACLSSGDQVSLRAASARMIRHGRLAESIKGVQIGGGLLALLGKVDGVAGDFAWDRSACHCRDGAAGLVPITTGAPHLRFANVAVGEGIA
jgi:TldD protein